MLLICKGLRPLFRSKAPFTTRYASSKSTIPSLPKHIEKSKRSTREHGTDAEERSGTAEKDVVLRATEDPSSPYRPFRAPPGAPPIGKRFADRFPFLRTLKGRDIIWYMLFLPPLYLLYMHWPVQLFWLRGLSMFPNFNRDHLPNNIRNKDDVCLLDVRSSIKQNLQRGDVVAFRTPYDPERWGVKRIVALAGDKIKPLSGYPGGDEPVIVPWGHIWVEGDAKDREKSVDSNWYGPISRMLIVGKLLCIAWPPKHWEAIKPHQYGFERLTVNAVRLRDPDEELASNTLFADDYAPHMLAQLRKSPETRRSMVDTAEKRKMMKKLLGECAEMIRAEDPVYGETAQALFDEAKKALEESQASNREPRASQNSRIAHTVPESVEGLERG